MADQLVYLEAVVGADITDFRRQMQNVRNDVGLLSSTIGGISGAARSMTYAFTIPMVGLGVAAVSAASGFDAAMRNINSITGMSESQFQAFSGTVLDFAKTTRAGVTPAVQALYEVFSAGITDQTKAMGIWEASNKVAEAGLADLSSTTNAMTATMSAYNLNTDQATHVGNVWTRMVQVGVGSMDDFLSGAQKILPVSSAMNISLEDMGATLAFLSQGGGGASKAETSYAMMLTNMMKPTTAMTDALHSLGVQSGTQLIAKFGSVGEAVMALKTKVGDVDFTKLFSKTGLEAALRITTNFQGLNTAITAFNKNLDSATMDAWSEQSKSFAAHFDLLKTALGAVAVTIGMQIIPMIQPLVDGFTKFALSITDANPELLKLGVIFVGVLAAAAPLIWVLTGLLNPIGLVVAAVTTLGGAFALNFGGIRDTIMGTVGTATGDLKTLGDGISMFLNTLFPKQADIDAAAGSPVVVSMADHITVTEPESLWQIYKDKGYDKKFSWQDFMVEAKKGGWKGGAINVGDEITITGTEQLGDTSGKGFKSGMQNALHGAGAQIWEDAGGLGGVASVPPTLWDNFVSAITVAWPVISAALNTLWSNFKVWVTTTAIPALDQAGSTVLDTIAGWFGGQTSTGGGKSPVYDAIRGIFNGAPQAVSDGITQNFPGITSSLGQLLGSIGNWFMKSALPTLARTIGYVFGTLAVGIGELMGGLWNALKPGGSGQGDAGQAAQAVNDSILTPMSAGFQNAMQDNSVKDGLDSFATGLAGAIVEAIVAAKVGTMILGAIMSSLGGAAAAGGAAGAAGAGAGTAGIGSSIISGIATFIRANPVVAGVTLGLYIGNIPAVQKAVSGFLDSLFGKDFSAKVGAGFETAVNTAIASSNATQANANLQYDLTTTFQVVDDTGNVITPTSAQGMIDNALAFSGLGGTGTNTVKSTPVPVDVGLQVATSMTWGSGTQGVFQNSLTDALSAEVNAQLAQAPDISVTDPLGLDVPVTFMFHDDAGNVITPTTATDIFQQALEAAGMGGDTGATVGGSEGTGGKGKRRDKQRGNGGGSSMGADFANQLVTDIQTSITAALPQIQVAAGSIVAPFTTDFTAAFGVAGTVTSSWSLFTSMFDTSLTVLVATTQKTMPPFVAMIKGSMTSAELMVKNAGDAVRALGALLNGLDGKTIHYTIKSDSDAQPGQQGTSTSTTATPHANGLYDVPHNNYPAILHDGETVLNAAESDDYRRSRVAVPPVSHTTQNIDNSAPTFIIQGNKSVDEIIMEFRKKGYNLDRYTK